MFNSKTFNLLILAVFLFVIYICFKDKKKKDLEDFSYITPVRPIRQNRNLKSILKKNKCENNNKRVSFILPHEENYSYVDVKNMKVPKTQFAFPEEENLNKESLQADKLCMNNKLDKYQPYPNRLAEIKNCDKVDGPVTIKDVYDSLIVDYKRDIKEKVPLIGSTNIESAAFGLSSYTNTDWSYQNENISNGGKMENGLYAVDPKISNEATI